MSEHVEKPVIIATQLQLLNIFHAVCPGAWKCGSYECVFSCSNMCVHVSFSITGLDSDMSEVFGS